MDLTADRPAEVEARLRELRWIGANERVVALGPAGAGNMNRTLRVTLPARTLIVKQAVPFVAKYPHIPAPVERQDTEAAFYREVARSDALAMRTPRILGTDPADHLLCMEDLGTGGDLTWIYQGQAAIAARRDELRGQFTALFYWLWKLHALNLDRGAALPPALLGNHTMRTLNHAHIFVIPFAADNGVEIPGSLRQIQAEFAADSRLVDRARALGQIYTGHAPHDSRPALVHGDYYPGSWLGHPRMGVVVIDPEFAFVGAPEFDVGVLLAHLILAGYGQLEVGMQLRSYVTPPGFSQPLALAFAGMEIIRRLLGVAQLPLAAPTELLAAWLQAARALVTAPEVPVR